MAITVEDGVGCVRQYFIPVSVGTTLAAEAGPNGNVCAGDPYIVGGSPTATGGDGNYSYSWTPDNGTLTDVSLSNPEASPVITTMYYVTVTDGLGCQRTDSVLVSIVPAPILDPINDTTSCDSYILPNIQGTSLSGTESYNTASDGSGTSYAEGAAINFADFPSYPVTLYAVDMAGGCSDFEPFSLTILESPILDPIGPLVGCVDGINDG